VNLRTPGEAAAIGIAWCTRNRSWPRISPLRKISSRARGGKSTRLVNRKRITERAARLIEQHNFPLQADWKVEKLSPAGKQLVEICRAIERGSSLLIFDEPTSSLSKAETMRYSDRSALGAEGWSHLHDTPAPKATFHRPESDCFFALDERARGPLAELTREQLTRHMFAADRGNLYATNIFTPGDTLLESRSFVKEEAAWDLAEASGGRDHGMAGFDRRRRTELCRAIFGVDRLDSGRILVEGKAVRITSPRGGRGRRGLPGQETGRSPAWRCRYPSCEHNHGDVRRSAASASST